MTNINKNDIINRSDEIMKLFMADVRNQPERVLTQIVVVDTYTNYLLSLLKEVIICFQKSKRQNVNILMQFSNYDPHTKNICYGKQQEKN